ncbi:hypothetical protein BT63DRAFT_422895 [Neofusicoccum parvum]|nr:hypothetical protein BT63DRAFT_422895 [Neofusicoccum parvum]
MLFVRPAPKNWRTLAFALASGIIQVYNTPWLQDSWSSSDIHVDLQTTTLYVIKNFSPTIPDPHSSTAHQNNPQDNLLVKNRALFSLTIALLELTYGAPLSSHKTPADLDDAYTPYRIAERLTKKVQDDELPRFASVVGRCMYPTPEGACEFSFSNEGVRKRFWKEIVTPLQQDWEELVAPPIGFQDYSG